MEKISIDTMQGVFLIKFKANTNPFIFNFANEVLGDLIKENNRYGIEYIKRFQPSRETFKKMSKSEIEGTFNWDTHTIQELKKANFIK